MKKWVMIMAALVVAAAVQAETMTGTVFAKNAGGVDYWKIGKEAKDGKMMTIANTSAADAEKMVSFDGKMVEITGSLNPESKFPSFLPGIEIKAVE